MRIEWEVIVSAIMCFIVIPATLGAILAWDFGGDWHWPSFWIGFAVGTTTPACLLGFEFLVRKWF